MKMHLPAVWTPGAGPRLRRGTMAGGRKGRRGFTLIEVMVAAIVASVGLLTSFYLIAQSTSMNADSKAVMAAHLAAQQEIETLRNTPFASLATTTFTPSTSNLSGATGAVTVADHGDGSGNLKDATVAVSWKDRGGATRTVAVATTIGSGGIDPQ